MINVEVEKHRGHVQAKARPQRAPHLVKGAQEDWCVRHCVRCRSAVAAQLPVRALRRALGLRAWRHVRGGPRRRPRLCAESIAACSDRPFPGGSRMRRLCCPVHRCLRRRRAGRHAHSREQRLLQQLRPVVERLRREPRVGAHAIGGQALRDVALQHREHQPLGGRRNVLPRRRRAHGVLPHDLSQHIDRVLVLIPRALAGKHHEERHTERPDVGRQPIRPPLLDLGRPGRHLGSHVCRRAAQPMQRVGAPLTLLRCPEVDHLDLERAQRLRAALAGS